MDSAGTDERGDVVRDMPLKQTSDVKQWTVELTKKSLILEARFFDHRKSTVKAFQSDVHVLGGADFYLDDPFGHAPELTSSIGEPVCEAKVEKKTGTNGWFRISVDRGCLGPEGDSSSVTAVEVTYLQVMGGSPLNLAAPPARGTHAAAPAAPAAAAEGSWHDRFNGPVLSGWITDGVLLP